MGAMSRPGSQSSQPNVLFVIADDHAPAAISSYGASLVATPNLDRLASEGARFDRCFCTNSICTPARATVLTGKYSHTTGIRTLAGAVVAAGYEPGRDVLFALDCAASEFHSSGEYCLAGEGCRYGSEEFCDYLGALVDEYPISSLRTAWMSRTGRVGECSLTAWAAASSWSATIFSSPTLRCWPEAFARASPMPF